MRNYALLLAGFCLLNVPLSAAQQPPAKPAAEAPKVAERKEVKVTEKVLTSYVGDYEMGPDRILHITLENGYLHGQPGEQQKRQLFAESPTKFFLKDLDVQLEFKKDATGVVTGLTMVQRGEAREGKKIK